MTGITPENRGALPPDEHSLLEGARRLDEPALSAIFDAYYEALFRYIRRHIGGSQTSEDLVAEVFRIFLEQLQAGRGPTRYLRAWLYRVAHNLVVDELRRGKHRDHADLDEDRHAGDSEPGDLVQTEMANQAARDALDQLTGKQRAVLIMRFLHGLEIEEVAHALNMTHGTVKALQHRGLEAMRRHLKRAGSLDETEL